MVSTELAKRNPASVMEVLARVAANPRAEVAKLQALLDMQVRVELRQAEVEFNAALARLMPKIARYEDIDRVTRPLLAEEGFSISFRTEEPTPGYVRVIGRLAHCMGHALESSVTVPISAPPKATGTQAVGSSVSYGKRYVVVNMLNIITVGEDTDGVDVTPISAEQVLTIETLLQDTKADRVKFFKWLNSLNGQGDATKLEQILEQNFELCVKALEAKKRHA